MKNEGRYFNRNTDRILYFLFLFIVFLTISPTLEAQQVVTGRITDAYDGQPLFGANIFVVNTTVGTASDESGNYRITIPGVGSYEIVVYYVGYEPFFYKIDVPKPFHQIDVAMKIKELSEVVITAPLNYRRRDVNIFWRALLGMNPSRRGLEVLNPEKVTFYLTGDNVLKVHCNEPIEIVNHEMGYSIQYVLQSFQHDYEKDQSQIYGTPFFEELIPQNTNQKNRWEKKRQEVYSVSITHFIRALYRQKIHEEGFLLVKRDESRRINTTFPLADILKTDNEQVIVTIDSSLHLGCFAMSVTEKLIENSYISMSVSYTVLNDNFPVVLLLPQQFSIFSDGTFSGVLRIRNLRNQITGLSAMLPVEYGNNE